MALPIFGTIHTPLTSAPALKSFLAQLKHETAMVHFGCLCVVAAVAAELCSGFVVPIETLVSRSTTVGSYARTSSSARCLNSLGSRSVNAALPRTSYLDSARRRRSHGLKVKVGDGQMQDAPSKWGSGGINVSGDAPFEIRGFSLANAASVVGTAITAASFYEYFSSGSGGLSGIGFVYGIPVMLVGLALKYAELPPAPLQTTQEAEALFEEKATDTIRAIKKDVTRHRYGDDAHLDSTVKSLGLVMPGSEYPQLQYLTQTVEPNGELGFSMVFQSTTTPFKRWAEPERMEKYVSFFGPGVDAEVVKVDRDQKLVAIKLTTLPPGVFPSSKLPPPEDASADEVPAPAEAGAEAAAASE